jgi:hypothetical protein
VQKLQFCKCVEEDKIRDTFKIWANVGEGVHNAHLGDKKVARINSLLNQVVTRYQILRILLLKGTNDHVNAPFSFYLHGIHSVTSLAISQVSFMSDTFLRITLALSYRWLPGSKPCVAIPHLRIYTAVDVPLNGFKGVSKLALQRLLLCIPFMGHSWHSWVYFIQQEQCEQYNDLVLSMPGAHACKPLSQCLTQLSLLLKGTNDPVNAPFSF